LACSAEFVVLVVHAITGMADIARKACLALPHWTAQLPHPSIAISLKGSNT